MASNLENLRPLQLRYPYLQIVMITRAICSDSVVIILTAEDGREIITLIPYS